MNTKKRKKFKKIRVLVVDDSALMRKLIPLMLEKAPEIEVVATAVDGIFALRKTEKFKPDVVTLDMDMPRMDGLTTLDHLVQEHNMPVVIVSSLTTRGAAITMKALEKGAMEVVSKPRAAISVNIQDIAQELIQKVRSVYGTTPLKLVPVRPIPKPEKEFEELQKKLLAKAPLLKMRRPAAVVAIGISTGGPNALTYFLPKIPGDFPAALLIVQHMPAGFTEVFASRLNRLCQIEVKEAKDGDLVVPGRALVAPGGKHMKIKKMDFGTIVILSVSPPVNGHRPSVDVLFDSVSKEFRANTLGVIMTGMGDDGARGITGIKQAGGRTIAQDEETSVVFGMPKVAIEMGHIDRIVPLDNIAEAIVSYSLKTKEKGGTGHVATKR